MFFKKNLLYLLVVLGLFSCSTTKDIAYFQDLRSGQNEVANLANLQVRLQANDKISIFVNSKDPLLADLFNLPVLSRQIGMTNEQGVSTHYQKGMSGYLIASDGCINFPVLGKVKASGKTRTELAEYIKEALISKNLVKDPVVTVDFMNLGFGVLGEVRNPGRYLIEREQVTILDALSMAGDLTIYGNRTSVMVLRKIDNKEYVYHLNLCSGNDIYNSPAYYLQQNDIVYVKPNKFRSREATVNGNSWYSTSFWLSVGSLLTTIAILIYK